MTSVQSLPSMIDTVRSAMSAEFFQRGEANDQTEQSRRSLRIRPTPTLSRPSTSSRHRDPPTVTQAERKRHKQAAEEAAKTARNALLFRNEQLKKWKKAPLKNQKAADFYDRVYFERLNELLGR